MINRQIEEYIERFSSQPDELLYDLWRYTWLHTMNPRMAAGPQHGLFLAMICRMLRPKRILEIGTFTGYAAIAMARELPPEGKLMGIEANEEYLQIARHYVEKAGLQNSIELLHGDALKLLPEIKGPFELIYLDADKISYPKYYMDMRRLLAPGGFLLVDNVLWGGKVADEQANERDTKAMREFNTLIATDESFEQLILAVRDGLMMAQKVK